MGGRKRGRKGTGWLERIVVGGERERRKLEEFDEWRR